MPLHLGVEPCKIPPSTVVCPLMPLFRSCFGNCVFSLPVIARRHSLPADFWFSGSNHFSAFPSTMFPKAQEWGCTADISTGTGHPVVICSLHLGWFWLSVVSPSMTSPSVVTKELLGWGVRASLTCGCNTINKNSDIAQFLHGCWNPILVNMLE